MSKPALDRFLVLRLQGEGCNGVDTLCAFKFGTAIKDTVEETFAALIDWLRSKGVQANKPLHTLRKLYGSALADLHGLHAASSGLRHADIKTTHEFYADRRVKVTPGFGPAILGASVTHFSLEEGTAR